MKMNGARILLESLKREGVDLVFGYPGGTVINIYDELMNVREIRHILPRQSLRFRPQSFRQAKMLRDLLAGRAALSQPAAGARRRRLGGQAGRRPAGRRRFRTRGRLA